MNRHTAPTDIIDITLPPKTSTNPLTIPLADIPVTPIEPTQWESTDTTIVTLPEIPEPIPHEQFPTTDDTNLITLPSFDWSNTDEIHHLLQVRLVDLEAWLQLRDRYGAINNLVALINSDLVMLGEGDRQFAEVPDFS